MVAVRVRSHPALIVGQLRRIVFLECSKESVKRVERSGIAARWEDRRMGNSLDNVGIVRVKGISSPIKTDDNGSLASLSLMLD